METGAKASTFIVEFSIRGAKKENGKIGGEKKIGFPYLHVKVHVCASIIGTAEELFPTLLLRN
jgi:hypothetical protein